jgi:RNA polymerase sigma-70 factor (ECF subfamily)
VETTVDDVKLLIAAEIPRLRRFALSLAGDPDAADDLVQDCLERAIRKRHLWRRYGSIRGWLYRILYNVFLNQASRRRKARLEVDVEEPGVTLSEPARQEQQMICDDIVQAMRALPGEQRAAIALTALEGFTYDEAAEILRVPIGTLRSRIARGRERLRELHVDPPARVALRRVK